MSIPDPQSFNLSITGHVSPLRSPTTPNRPVYMMSAFEALSAEQKRNAVVIWLQDNIVPLVGPDAADTLPQLLGNTEAANDFVNKTLKFLMKLERGIQTPYDAVEEWHTRRKAD